MRPVRSLSASETRVAELPANETGHDVHAGIFRSLDLGTKAFEVRRREMLEDGTSEAEGNEFPRARSEVAQHATPDDVGRRPRINRTAALGHAHALRLPCACPACGLRDNGPSTYSGDGPMDNTAIDGAPSPETLELIAADLLELSPTMRLLMGPQAVRILREMQRGHASLGDAMLLDGNLESAERRGRQLDVGPEFKDLVKARRRLQVYLEEYGIPGFEPPPRAANPRRVRTIELHPTDEDQRTLALRVVGIYQPVFRWEPNIKITSGPERVIVQVSGEEELVDNLVNMIFNTLSANSYRGAWKSDVRRPNLVSALLR